jgi:hypothetical protein
MVVSMSHGHCNVRLTISLFNDSVSIIEISLYSNQLGESCLLFEGNRKIDQTAENHEKLNWCLVRYSEGTYRIHLEFNARTCRDFFCSRYKVVSNVDTETEIIKIKRRTCIITAT